MPYTVHEVAELSGVTIKTLYHYQNIRKTNIQRQRK